MQDGESLRLIPMMPADESFILANDLMRRAFPLNQRREEAVQKELLKSNRNFQCLGIFRRDKFSGFLTWWDLEEFAFIEHFAILPGLRSRGLGTTALEAALGIISQPAVLEVDKSDSPDAKRRISFYQKFGFILQEYPYSQPPYRPGESPVPMWLMSNDNSACILKYIQKIRRYVYGSDPGILQG